MEKSFLYIQLYEKDFVVPDDVLCACECSRFQAN